ncbi:MAG: hypothetical protein CM15mP75_0150 [Flammeovirgaceae bacterium]|nr:MAG: hypothetical protein CM15mP75_0150 [Flammeovirgaceae bacterium]
MCERMANELRLPLIRMVEGSGGGGSVKTIETTGRANVPGVAGWEVVVENMGTIPRVALGLGSVAGLGAAHLAAAHYSVMIKGKLRPLRRRSPVVERLGQKLTKMNWAVGKFSSGAAPSIMRSIPKRNPFECPPDAFSPLPPFRFRWGPARPPRGRSKSQGRMAYRCHPARDIRKAHKFPTDYRSSGR